MKTISMTRIEAGFTLIETAIVLAIVSALAVGAVNMLRVQRLNSGIAETELIRDRISAALRMHVINHGRLPCPADPDAVIENEVDYGVEDCAIAGTVMIGTLPIRALQGGPGEYIDGWGNRFAYAVIQPATVADSWTSTSWTTSPANSITVNYEGATQIANGVVAFISYGANQSGAIAKTSKIVGGVPVVAPRAGPPATATFELENLNGDPVIETAQFSDAEDEPFDDMVTAFTEQSLMSPIISSGALSAKEVVTSERVKLARQQAIALAMEDACYAVPTEGAVQSLLNAEDRVSAWGQPITLISSGANFVISGRRFATDPDPIQSAGNMDAILADAGFDVGSPPGSCP